MRADNDTVDPIACVAAAIAVLTVQPRSAPQQRCWVGLSHGGTPAMPAELADIPCTADAAPSAAAIGIACPSIGMDASRAPAELAMTEWCCVIAGLAHAASPDATERWSMVTDESRAIRRRRIMRG